MRIPLPFLFLTLGQLLNAQQVDWLHGSAVDFDLNPGMPRHALASAPGRLVAMRTVDVGFIYGSDTYGSIALDALDPASGSTLLSCLLLDSVSVGAVAVDPAGIAYFTGRFMGDALEFCDGSQLPGINGGIFTTNHFLLAWDLVNGSALWMRNLSASYPNGEEVPSIALDPNGNLWYLMQDFLDGRVARVDANGDDAEVREIHGIRRFGTISFDPWGGLYVSGSCENGTLTFGGSDFAVSSTGGYNMFVLRYRPDGSAGFAQFGPDITFTNPTVVAGGDGHAYLSGALYLDGEVWPGLLFEGVEWGADVFVAKLDSTGQFIWGRESHQADAGITGDFSQSSGPGIAVDAEDNVYLTGANRGVVDWGNGVQCTGAIPGRSLSVVAFSPDGTAQWAVSSAPSNWYVEAQSIAATAESGAIHFICHAADALTMGGFTTGAQGAQSAVLGRIADFSTDVSALPGTATRPLLWPNPVVDIVQVDMGNKQPMPATLMDRTGRMVRSVSLRPGRNAIDLSGLPPGLYIMRTSLGSARMVKQ